MCGYAGIGRQAWLRAKWGFPVRVRVSLAAPKVKRINSYFFDKLPKGTSGKIKRFKIKNLIVK